MTKKLTTAIATDMVDRLEALRTKFEADERAIYEEACAFDGRNNDSVIRDAVKARAELREAEYNASALLASFDAEEE